MGRWSNFSSVDEFGSLSPDLCMLAAFESMGLLAKGGCEHRVVLPNGQDIDGYCYVPSKAFSDTRKSKSSQPTGAMFCVDCGDMRPATPDEWGRFYLTGAIPDTLEVLHLMGIVHLERQAADDGSYASKRAKRAYEHLRGWYGDLEFLNVDVVKVVGTVRPKRKRKLRATAGRGIWELVAQLAKALPRMPKYFTRKDVVAELACTYIEKHRVGLVLKILKDAELAVPKKPRGWVWVNLLKGDEENAKQGVR